MSKTNRWFAFIKAHWPIVLIVFLATLLRTWQLDSKAILFGDAAVDLWSAKTAVETRTLPLLGIASSVPRFKQGPVAVWIEMVTYAVAGSHLFAYSLVFAGLSLAAVVGLYELLVTQTNAKTAYWGSVLLAVSPLAVAHGRMPYHITPLPFALVIACYALVKLWQSPRRFSYWFWAGLSLAVVFQFELAITPLFLWLPYIAWRRIWLVHRRNLSGWFKMLASAMAGFGLGMWPQLVHDATHGWQQLGGFALWVGYRLVGNVGLVGGDRLWSVTKFTTFTQSLATYGTRIVSVDQPAVALGAVLVLGWSLHRLWGLSRSGKLWPLTELAVVGFGFLLLGFGLHGSPSEAYYPPLLILLPIIVATAVTTAPRSVLRPLQGILVVWVGWMIVTIFQANFFVSRSEQTFSYGPGSGEQRQILAVLAAQDFTSVLLRTTNPGGIYPSYFANLKWLAQETPVRILSEKPSDTLVPTILVESPDTNLRAYPDATIYTLPSVVLVHVPQL